MKCAHSLNLPNKLTLLRILMIPLCVLFLLTHQYIIAAVLFITACITDFLDGYIARRQGIVTNFGIFADPVADKILVLSMMITLLYMDMFPWWAVLIVSARELAVDGLRLVAAERGVVIPAGSLGKLKTNAQYASVLSWTLSAPALLSMALAILMSALTAISGIQYFYQARHLLSDGAE